MNDNKKCRETIKNVAFSRLQDACSENKGSPTVRRDVSGIATGVVVRKGFDPDVLSIQIIGDAVLGEGEFVGMRPQPTEGSGQRRGGYPGLFTGLPSGTVHETAP